MSDAVDLTDFQYMPLYIGRLQRSKAWLRCKRQPELAFYMLNLWLRSWHEIPAGTIENDDDVLADAAMCSPEKWSKLRDKVMAGWSTREDGRLEHPVVAEIAASSWSDKQEYRRKREEERLRKAAKRAHPSEPNPPEGGGVSAGCPADSDGTGDGIPPENALKEREVKESVRDTSKTRDPDAKKLRFDQIRAALNIDPDDTTWTAINGWCDAWLVRGADFNADVLATVLMMMAKKPKNWTPRALSYFDTTIQENFDARVRRAELPPPKSSLPPAEFNPELEKWRLRVDAFYSSGTWSTTWGPTPDEGGCHAPASVRKARAA